VAHPNDRPGAAVCNRHLQGLADSPGFTAIPSMSPLILLVLRTMQSME
jgi:hypothetical protein